MAIDYDIIGDDLGIMAQIFTNLRRIRVGGSHAQINGWDYFKTQVEALFNTDDKHKFMLPLFLEFCQRRQGEMDNAINELASLIGTWTTAYLKYQIESTGVNPDDILLDLREAMMNDNKLVKANTIAVTAVIDDGENVGNQQLVVSILEPEEGTNNQRIVNEDFNAECVRDKTSIGDSGGSEVFEVQGSMHKNGEDVSIKWNQSASENRIKNGSPFTFAVTDVPDSWTNVAGTRGTHIKQSTDYYRDSTSKVLKFIGDGAQATITEKQIHANMSGYSSTAQLKPLKHYLLSCAIKTSGLTAGDSVTIKMKGTSYVEESTEKINITASFPAAYAVSRAVIIMPKEIPSDFAIHVIGDGTFANGAYALFDDLVLCEMTEWEDAGIVYGFIRGLQDPVASVALADYHTFSTTNSLDALFQTLLTDITDPLDPEGNKKPDIGIAMPADTSETSEFAEDKATL